MLRLTDRKRLNSQFLIQLLTTFFKRGPHDYSSFRANLLYSILFEHDPGEQCICAHPPPNKQNLGVPKRRMDTIEWHIVVPYGMTLGNVVFNTQFYCSYNLDLLVM